MKTTTPLPRVVVLHDHIPLGADADALDNLTQARQVTESLQRLGFEVVSVAMSRDIATTVQSLYAASPQLVFNLVESLEGDGTLVHVAPTLLEALGLRFTGAPATAHVCTGDKRIAKRLMQSAAIATPAFAVDAHELAQWSEFDLGIVKPARQDASVAIDCDSVVRGRNELQRELRRRRQRYAGEWFVERYLSGREFNVSLLMHGDQVISLPVAEIRFVDFPLDRPCIVDYEAKWCVDSFAYQHTPRHFPSPDEEPLLLQQLQDIALACHRLFELGSYARVDIRLDMYGVPHVLEVNANPCLSHDAGFLAAAKRAGLTCDEVIEQIVTHALEDDTAMAPQWQAIQRTGERVLNGLFTQGT